MPSARPRLPAKKVMLHLCTDGRCGVPISAVILISVKDHQPEQDNESNCQGSHRASSPISTDTDNPGCRHRQASRPATQSPAECTPKRRFSIDLRRYRVATKEI